jgi:hypothetical protein
MFRLDARTARFATAIFAAMTLFYAAPQARAYESGQSVVTEGLVCDKDSEVDAVVTLMLHGEDLPSALGQINAGAQVPRCSAGQTLLTTYVEKVHTFYIKDNAYTVHKVRVLGVATKTPIGVVPQALDEPMEQFIVSTEKATGA